MIAHAVRRLKLRDYLEFEDNLGCRMRSCPKNQRKSQSQ